MAAGSRKRSIDDRRIQLRQVFLTSSMFLFLDLEFLGAGDTRARCSRPSGINGEARRA